MAKIAFYLSFIVIINAQTASILEFDGTDDYVDLGVVEGTNFTTADFSIQVWVKTTSTKAQSILVKGDGDEVWEAGEKALYIEAAGYPWFVGYDNEYIPGTGLKVNDGLWHHIVVTWDYSGSGATDSDGTAAIYVDGVKASVANSYRAQTGDNDSDRLFLAKKNGNDAEAPNYFDGAIAEVAIWDSALTSSDITSLYTNYSKSYGIGDRYSPQGALYYWKLNDALGSSSVRFVDNKSKNLYLDGVDDWIQTKNGFGEEDMPIDSEGSYAVSVWAKANSNSSGLMEIISQGKVGSNFYLGSSNTGDKIRAGDDWENTGVDFPRDDKWHHYVLSRSSSNTYLYVDGSLSATKGSAIGHPDGGTGLRIGRQYGTAGEYFYGSAGTKKSRVLIGKDTRLSGYMLEPALVAGFTSVGLDAITTGPLPTPAIAHLTRVLRCDLGVMISASHNPYQDNGLKLFGADGFKLNDEVENEIQSRMISGPTLAKSENLGRARRMEDAIGRYSEFVKQI